MADNELANILNRRNRINEGEEPLPTDSVQIKSAESAEVSEVGTDASKELANKLNR